MKVSLKKFRKLVIVISIIALLPSVVGFAPSPKKIWEAHPPIHVKQNATIPTGYNPSQIRTAYGLDLLSANGSGQTIAIVDAYGSPNISNDLLVFNQQFGLPTADLTIAYAYSGAKTKTNSAWALETSLDVEWAHAIAPNAKILLVIAKSASTSDLLKAIDYATSHGAQVVSMSWGGSEFSSEAHYESHFKNTGIIYVASSGDKGAGVQWPAASPNVLSVGGTTLTLDSNGNYLSETGWSGSGGGVSSYMSMPSYHSNWTSIVGSHRGVLDVAFNADPNTGVAVYDSTTHNDQSGWFEVSGTSLSAPVWAAMIALADQRRTSSLTSVNVITDLYNIAGKMESTGYLTNYHDITQGNNGYNAQQGYDLVTGIGSPKANNLILALTNAN
ncbi:MAG: S53 family peptidase [Desulfosporosinus sp.]|nr:S53 family peptidase [Desulfosporosinus sp.]